MLALLLAASGAALVPAQADGALVLDGPSGAAGLRALFETAGRHAMSLSPQAIGDMLRDAVGVDLLAEQPAWALAKHGPRALVAWRRSVGLSAPIANARQAREALNAWVRPPRPKKGLIAAGDRAGTIRKVGGQLRLLVASGRDASALVLALARPRMFSRDKALLSHAAGPAWVYLAGQPPLRAAVFALDASAGGLVARGLVTPLRDAILDGPAPDGCEGLPPGCLRAGLGPAGRELLVLAFARLGLAAPPEGPAVVVRLLGVDAQRLSDERSWSRALHVAATAEPPAAAGASLEGRLDVAEIDSALAKLSPLDTLHGTLAAFAYAAHLLYGALLRNCGPLALSGTPAAKGAAEIELRLPLRQGPL